MRLVAEAGLSRQADALPQFLMLHHDELAALLLVPERARALFLELLKAANFATGLGTTAWTRLATLLGYPNPRTEGLITPTVKEVRTAFEQLERVRLVERDTKRNEGAKALFFRVRARIGLGVPKADQGRGEGRPQRPAKRALARLSAVPVGRSGQRSGQGVQENALSPVSPSTPPVVHRPPTHAGPEQLADVLLRGAGLGVLQPGEAQRRAGFVQRGEKLAPRGGQEVAASGRTPPAEPSPLVKRMRAQLKPQQTDEGPPPSARLRQRRA